LEGRAHRRQERCVHRFRRNHSLQRYSGRKRNCRRGKCRYQGCAAARDRGRESSQVMRVLGQGTSESKASTPVPFLDLVTPHMELEQQLVGAFRTCLRTASFVGGSIVEGFEKAFAVYCQTDHAVAVGSGTDALRFALSLAALSREMWSSLFQIPSSPRRKLSRKPVPSRNLSTSTRALTTCRSRCCGVTLRHSVHATKQEGSSACGVVVR